MGSEICYRRSSCRLCDSTDLLLAIGLRKSPPANSFVPKTDLHIKQVKFPLDVFFCNDCGHLQLLDVINPRLLFENYVYVSGTSTVFVEHFRKYAKEIVDRFTNSPQKALIVEIGSNDGSLLKFFQEFGCKVLGVDPAIDIALSAVENGIETKVDFFTSDLAIGLRKSHGPAAVICANNVFAHADNLSDIVRGIKILLDKNGVFVFEVSYLLDVFEKTLFDTIYHEHLAYHSVGPLEKFFKNHGMELVSVKRVNTHGGSIRGMVQLKGGGLEVDKSVATLIAQEDECGLNTVLAFQKFQEEIAACKEKIVTHLTKLKKEGKEIAAFGAPAKATTLMHHFEIGANFINFIVDDNPLKQGLFSPGMHIPVLPAKALYEKKPDAVIILAWNFAESIMIKHEKYLEMGGQFLVPLPTFRVQKKEVKLAEHG